MVVAVVAGTTVVAGVAVSELPPHPETTNKNVSATAYFLTVGVCHPSPGERTAETGTSTRHGNYTEHRRSLSPQLVAMLTGERVVRKALVS